jgi:leucyl/phenylalanyl-tRNA---protein transferase
MRGRSTATPPAPGSRRISELSPDLLIAGYVNGIFPMPGERGELDWYAPGRRAVLPLDGLHVSRSLRRVLPRFDVTVDEAFGDVIGGCSDRGDGDWIDDTILTAYTELHRLGWAHSVEVWTREPRTLAGGLYGVAIGGLFAAESKFHVVRDASKVAVVALVELLRAGSAAGDRLLDAQWLTPHLASLGFVEISRSEYHARLDRALALPLPPAFL